LSNIIDRTLPEFLEKDRALSRSELDKGMTNWYWKNVAAPHFNTKDPALKAELIKNLFETDTDFTAATFVTDYVATADILRKKFGDFSGALRAIKFNFCKSGQGDDGTHTMTGEEYMNDPGKDIRSSNIKDFFPHNNKSNEMTKEGLALYYMFRVLHERGAADTAFGELPADATASSEGDPQLYSRATAKGPKPPQVDFAAVLKAPIKIDRSKDEEDFYAAEARKATAELALLEEKAKKAKDEQIDHDMTRLIEITEKLSGISKVTHTGTYTMFMSRREQLKTRLAAAGVCVSPASKEMLRDISS
jgi:hypothetical protein